MKTSLPLQQLETVYADIHHIFPQSIQSPPWGTGLYIVDLKPDSPNKSQQLLGNVSM